MEKDTVKFGKMKLIHCFECGDIFNLSSDREKVCSCGQSKGKYRRDGMHADITGPCVGIGFANHSFHDAFIRQQYDNKENSNKEIPAEECCLGQDFKAFFIPETALTVHRTDKTPEGVFGDFKNLREKHFMHLLRKEIEQDENNRN